MNRLELVDRVAARNTASKAEVDRIIVSALEEIISAVRCGESVTLIGFGAITFGRTDLNPRLTGLAVRVALPLVSTSQSGRAQTDVSIPVPHEPAAESAQSLPKDSKDPSK